MFPNPVKDKIFVNTEVDQILIFNVFGQIVEKFDYYNLSFINISNLNAGMYFIKLKKGNEIYLKKLIVK
ncbi:MAG TPA: T9SS type A sorting domain-containing protein [Bacteroidales bacterium]|nr:T9SS type A sorting domain-containing protein [Bacteroidales bacterium]HPD24068.1 T9SS type A sorting domain-containing protein [Bacteroidales bacterium]HRT00067.1 T9SS type A sorting domain-containing protein [Bacteroidales bacterium]HRT80555.1 T9SS type A sorting domain-containing protein [Bacteroidales bacterium]